MITIYLLIIRGIQLVEKCFSFMYNACCSFIFNLVYLPFKQAVYFPIWIEYPHIYRPQLCFDGRIIIDTDRLWPRMIRLGSRKTPHFKRGMTMSICGTLIFKGPIKIGQSSSVEVYKGACLTFGKNVGINDGFQLICANKITIGDNTSISWNVYIFDTDFHPFADAYTGKQYCKMTSPITIGKRNWIGADCIILKGFKTPDDVIIAAGTKCSSRKKIDEKTLIGLKNPCEVLIEGVYKMF